MRVATRLLASVKPGQFLEAGAPTGLTGLVTHPSPRSTLIYLYSSTLDKLKQIPESSVYRQSTEALTKHRLQIIQAVKPEGLDAWQQKIDYEVGENPDVFEVVETSMGRRIRQVGKKAFDERTKAAEWDGEVREPNKEGIRGIAERGHQHRKLAGEKGYSPELEFKETKLEPEPQLTAEQISNLESQIGAGLIEEVIQVAEGEHTLVDGMVKSKVWEELEEKAPEGQWTYFERGGHTNTQKP